MNTPEAYQGREQTFLKHRALWEYETQWGIKLGPTASKLWYVDAFAGLWESRDSAYQDTSPYLGIEALKYARSAHPARFSIGAILIEENRSRFERLESLVPRLRAGDVDVIALHGRFEDHVNTINSTIGADPALVFIDPKGWKGAGMRIVASVSIGRRDVLIRVASQVHRFASVDQSATEFFGLEFVPKGLSTDETIALYRQQLKQLASFKFTADMSVLSPTRDSISSWLVVGGRHPTVLEVFRDVEAKVVGAIAAEVRENAKIANEIARTGQYPLFDQPPSMPDLDRLYEETRASGRIRAKTEILTSLTDGPRAFQALWPGILERHHITKRDVRDVARDLVTSGQLRDPRRPRERTIKDEHVLTLARKAATTAAPRQHKSTG